MEFSQVGAGAVGVAHLIAKMLEQEGLSAGAPVVDVEEGKRENYRNENEEMK